MPKGTDDPRRPPWVRPHLFRAFTLIEVLVVVAIIALLIAVLLPSLNRARWQAKKTACCSNLHDLGTAFMTYASVSREYFPLTRHPADDTLLTLWKAHLLKDLKILVCPATKHVVRPQTLKGVEKSALSMADAEIPVPYLDPISDIEQTARSDGHPEDPGGPNDSAGGMSYEYQGMYGPCLTTPPYPLQLCHKKASQFIMPPYQVMLVIEGDDGWKGDPTGCRNALNGDQDGNNCPQPWDNHGAEGMNIMYSDGHADWMKKMAGLREYDQHGRLKNPVFDENKSISMLWLKSDHPWVLKP